MFQVSGTEARKKKVQKYLATQKSLIYYKKRCRNLKKIINENKTNTALDNEIERLDTCLGHSAPNIFQYHYHGVSKTFF